MATVVVVLVVTFDASSIPSLTLVMAASVVSGSISEIEPTNVVLPTANPPAITIFTGMGAGAVGASPMSAVAMSEGLEAIEDPFEQSEIRSTSGRAGVDGDVSLVDEIAQDDPGDPERETKTGRDLGRGEWGCEQVQDLAPLEGEGGGGLLTLRGAVDDRFDLEFGAGARAPARDGVRTDPEAVTRIAIGAHLGRAPWSSARNSGVRTWPARSTSTVIS